MTPYWVVVFETFVQLYTYLCIIYYPIPSHKQPPFSDTTQQVLPAFAPRFALTCWFYGRPRFPPLSIITTTTTIPLRQPPLPTANGASPSTSSSPAATTAPAQAGGGEKEKDGWTTAPPPPLPLPTNTTPQQRQQQQTIFVSIAAYRDPEIGPTLESLFAAAAHPERVSVGVVWQGVEGDEDGLDGAVSEGKGALYAWFEQVRILRLHAAEAAGPCWARHLGQALWQGETFLLQVDSHMRFRPGWDAYLVGVLTGGGCGPEMGRRAVLTTYPVGYELLVTSGGGGGIRVPTDVRPTLLCPSKVRAWGLWCIFTCVCKPRLNHPLIVPLPQQNTQNSSTPTASSAKPRAAAVPPSPTMPPFPPSYGPPAFRLVGPNRFWTPAPMTPTCATSSSGRRSRWRHGM